MPYAEIFAEFPQKLRLPVARLVDAIKEDFGVRRTDFDDLKAVVRDLAEAQKRTELRVEELAVAQKNMQEELTQFRRTFVSQMGGLGARWGLQTEEAFRQGMRAILQEVGFSTERFLDFDSTGEVFGSPDQVEIDVIIKNGKVILIEIKSSLDRAGVHYFNRKVGFYAHKTGRQVDRKLIVTPYADARAKELASQLGVEIYTDVAELR
jgi:hypothetical protein